jgi:phosphatidylethanolamine-binding protein (PEBP) family uncharacterized protein
MSSYEDGGERMKLLDRPRAGTARRALLASALAAGLALAGCGGSSTRSSPSPTVTSAQSPSSSTGVNPTTRQTSGRSEPVPTVSILVKIPGLLSEQRIPERYTCNGADVSLPMRWSHVPSPTAELAVFVVNLRPVHGRFFFDWAVAGLSPATQGISAGTLPPGAVVGRNSFGTIGYSICPAKGRREDFVVRVLALPHPLAVTPGFDAETVYRAAERSAKVVGIGGGTYTRP